MTDMVVINGTQYRQEDAERRGLVDNKGELTEKGKALGEVSRQEQEAKDREAAKARAQGEESEEDSKSRDADDKSRSGKTTARSGSNK